ncbi:MAG: putative O-methyltransferase [Francisellaceae bacterium]|nr:putative O-methyltransferase [Francisellaceae bacterium]
MSERNLEIKEYITELFAKESEILISTNQLCQSENLPPMQISPMVGKFISMLTKMKKPNKILEIGTLGGYSTLWIAQSLSLTKDTKIICIELSEKHVEIASKNFQKAHMESFIDIRCGKAAFILDKMIKNDEGPFDLIFIDADKENYPLYLQQALQLSQSGTLIISDNLIPKSEQINNPGSHETGAKGIYEFNKQLSQHSTIDTILIPTITGQQGRLDAIGISLVK